MSEKEIEGLDRDEKEWVREEVGRKVVIEEVELGEILEEVGRQEGEREGEIEEIGREDVDEEVEHEAVMLEGGEVETQDEEEWVKEVSEDVGRKEVGLEVCKGREVLDFDGAWTKKKNLKKKVKERQYKKRGQESLVMPEDEEVGEERRESGSSWRR